MLSHGLRKLLGAWIDPRRTTTRRTGRHWWHITPAGEKLFGEEGPDLDGWVRDGLATVVKQGTQRTVYRVNLPGGAAFAKRCRVNGFRVWLRELLRPPKARLEFENAVLLRDLGLPVVEPLAWARLARLGPGESIFVTRAQDGAVPLQRYLEEVFPKVSGEESTVQRRAIARELGVLLARLHDAGVAHPDPHPGNLLATQRPGQAPTVTLIDLHAIRFGRPLSWRESLNNLVLFNRWFQLRASRSDRIRFWHAYVRHRTTLPIAGPMTLDRMARIVERRTEHSNARFWMTRFARYRKNSRHVHRLDGPRVGGYCVHDLPAKFAQRLLADPDAPFRDASVVLKDSPGSTVIELSVPTPTGPKTAIYKRFSLRSPLGMLKNLLRPSAALRSWLYGHNLLDRSLPTPRPLLVLERRRLGFLRAEGYLLAEKVDDALPLHDAAAAAESWRTIRAATTNVGRLLHDLHHKRVRHRDLKASNILINPKLVPVLIDLVGVTPDSRPLPRAVRVRDVARLAASFLRNSRVTRTDKLRVLRAYGAWGLRGGDGWKIWWRAIDAAIQRKQAKNARRGRPLA